MCLVEKGLQFTKNLAPFSAWDSLHNPLLEGNQEQFLSGEHIEKLKEESSIIEWEFIGEESVEGIGKLRRIGFITEQGYCYSALVGIPKKLESTIPIIGTSAWTTSTEGHNEHTVRNMVRAGNFVFFIGAEGSYEPAEKPEPLGPITLSSSAAAVLNFSYHTAKELADEGYDVDPAARAVIGESRGGMVGMGILALAEEFGQTIDYADLTAPCLPRKIRPKDIFKLFEQLAKEPREIAKLLGSLTLGRLIHYPATFDPSPYNLKHQLAIGFALFSGEAGALARRIQKDTLLHITVFSGDFASMRHEWEDIFQEHPNVQVTSLPGSHLTLADLETLMYLIGRNKAAQICHTEEEPLTKASVFEAAHLIAPEQEPLHKKAS